MGGGAGAGGSAERPIATFDLTGRCPLRCRHCYFYAAPVPDGDLDDRTYLRRLEEVRDRYGVRSAFWVGGEPLLRLPLLRRAMRLFRRNAVSTSGAVPIPDDLDSGLLVSLDGPRPIHDALRGSGAFDAALGHMGRLRAGSFALSMTLTSASAGAVSHLPALVETTRAAGALVGFHVGPPGDPMRLDGPERARAVDALLDLAATRPGVVLNPAASLALFHPDRLRDLASRCIYRDRAVAFDPHMVVKPPCTFGPRASCDACGCAVVATHASRDGTAGDPSEAALKVLFPRSSP